MRTVLALVLSLLITALGQQAFAGDCSASAADFDLQAAMSLIDTGKVKDAAELQKVINEDNGINNVDTTGSGTIDYMFVKQRRSGGTVYFDFMAVPQSAPDTTDPCLIATMQFSKNTSSGTTRVVILGSYNQTYVVGCDTCSYTYYSPWDWNPNPAVWVGAGLFFGWAFYTGPALWWGYDYRPWIGGGSWGWRRWHPYGSLISLRLGNYGRWGWRSRSVYKGARSWTKGGNARGRALGGGSGRGGTRGSSNASHVTRGNSTSHATRSSNVSHTTRGNSTSHVSRGSNVSHATRGNSTSHVTRSSNVSHATRSSNVSHTTRGNSTSHVSRGSSGGNGSSHAVRGGGGGGGGGSSHAVRGGGGGGGHRR